VVAVQVEAGNKRQKTKVEESRVRGMTKSRKAGTKETRIDWTNVLTKECTFASIG
jgi:hypothetical protein